MAKILILSTPYNGSTHFGESLATDLGYKFFDQPLDNEAPLKWKSPNASGELFEYDLPRGYSLHNGRYNNFRDGMIGYNYPNDVPEDSIVNHFFGWYKLPNNYSESEFLSTFIPKFTHVICLRCEDISWNWKQHLAAINQEHNGNWQWLRYLHRNNNYQYEDSHYDQEIVTKYEKAHNGFVNYIIDNSLAHINMDTEIWDYEFDYHHLKETFGRFNIPGLLDQDIDEVDEKNTHIIKYLVSNKWAHCRW